MHRLFVNGLPLAVLELKNAANEDATIWSAFQQGQPYNVEGTLSGSSQAGLWQIVDKYPLSSTV